jgi:hypothetical protein
VAEQTSTEAPSQLQSMTSEASDRAHDVASTTAEHLSALKDDAKEKVANVVHDARRDVERQGDEQAKRLASTLHDVSGQIRGMADAGTPGTVADVARQLATKSEHLAQRLDSGGIAGVGDDLRTFARRQPGLFLAAAGLAGFLTARVLRNAGGLSGAGSRSPDPSSGHLSGPGAPTAGSSTSASAGSSPTAPPPVPLESGSEVPLPASLSSPDLRP